MNGLLSTVAAKIILALGIGLVASMTGNFLLVRHMWMAAGEAKGEAERKRLADENAGFKATQQVNAALAKQAQEDHEDLLADLRDIAASTKGNKERSRKVTRDNPLPAVCVPGQARMDSVNKTLGPQ